MKTLMRNGRDPWNSENPSLGHAKKERVEFYSRGVQRITSGPAARRPHSKAEYMTAPERFTDHLKFLLHRGRRPYMFHRTRDLLMRQRTQVINALRAHLAELRHCGCARNVKGSKSY